MKMKNEKWKEIMAKKSKYRKIVSLKREVTKLINLFDWALQQAIPLKEGAFNPG
jgi:predicted nucleotide-binding protein (sugar kinase/HSP70/actin superfamily)